MHKKPRIKSDRVQSFEIFKITPLSPGISEIHRASMSHFISIPLIPVDRGVVLGRPDKNRPWSILSVKKNLIRITPRRSDQF